MRGKIREGRKRERQVKNKGRKAGRRDEKRREVRKKT